MYISVLSSKKKKMLSLLHDKIYDEPVLQTIPQQSLTET